MTRIPSCSPFWRDPRTGNKAASVLPEPVGATIRRSTPARILAIAAVCIRLSVAIPAAAKSPFSIESSVLRDLDDKASEKVTLPYKLIDGDCESIETIVAQAGTPARSQSLQARLGCELRLDESKSLRVATLSLPNRYCILLPIA